MRRMLAAVTLLAVAIAMAGCGVRGPLEPPPGAVPAEPVPPAAKNAKPAKPFVLDGLL